MLEPLLIGAGAGLIALIAGTPAVLWRRDVARLRQAMQAHDAALVDAERLRAARDEASKRALASERALEAWMSRQRALDAEQASQMAALGGQLTAAKTALGEARRQVEDTARRLEDTERRAESARREAAKAEVALRGLRQVLASVGLELPEAPLNPTAANQRPVTRRVVRELLVGSAARAAALVNDAGLAWFAAGSEQGARRATVAAAVASSAEAELGGLLCAPVDSVSVYAPLATVHLLRVPGHELWLAVENDGDAPLHAMRAARLKLAGAPAPASPVPISPETVIDLDDALDTPLTQTLSAWAARWGADAVTVLGEDGRPIASTEDAQPGAVVAARRALDTALRRMLRDRVPLDAVTVTARDRDGSAVALRPLADRIDAPLLAVRSAVELPEEALDQLAQALRWDHDSLHHTNREAS